jgi:hypothetical protein
VLGLFLPSRDRPKLEDFRMEPSATIEELSSGERVGLVGHLKKSSFVWDCNDVPRASKTSAKTLCADGSVARNLGSRHFARFIEVDIDERVIKSHVAPTTYPVDIR